MPKSIDAVPRRSTPSLEWPLLWRAKSAFFEVPLTRSPDRAVSLSSDYPSSFSTASDLAGNSRAAWGVNGLLHVARWGAAARH